MPNFVVLLIVALIVSAIGFRKYVWFISIGYGFSVCAIGLALIIMFRGQMDDLWNQAGRLPGVQGAADGFI